MMDSRLRGNDGGEGGNDGGEGGNDGGESGNDGQGLRINMLRRKPWRGGLFGTGALFDQSRFLR